MLTWDEEVKPSSQNQLDGGLPNNRQVGQPPLAFQTPSLQPVGATSSAANTSATPVTAAAHRRVCRASRAAALFHFDASAGKVQIVVENDHLLGLDLIEVQSLGGSFAGKVHIGLGL